jgi:hypothetical protein
LPTSGSNFLNKAELDAIAWHADQEVQAALKEGIISREQMDSHWQQVAGDLAADDLLLGRMVEAHQRWKRGGGSGSSKRVVLDHYGMLVPNAPAFEIAPHHDRDGGRNLAMAGMAALSLAMPLAAPLTQLPIPSSPSFRYPLRDPISDLPDLPPKDNRIELVSERDTRWVDKHRRRRRRDEPEIG